MVLDQNAGIRRPLNGFIGEGVTISGDELFPVR